MATSAGNNGNLIRFEDGAVVRVWDSTNTDDVTITNIGPGTVRWTDGFRARLPHIDRGVVTLVKAGDVVTSEIDLDCSITDDLSTFLSKLDLGVDANGEIITYKLQIELYKTRGATVGPRITWADCYLREPIQSQAGGTNAASSDMMSIRWGSITAAPTHDLWS